MVSKSKIIIFLITLLLSISLISCKKSKYDVIPDVYVDFTIDLNDIIFRDLNVITNHVIVTYQTNNWGARSAGYDSSGIIVYRSSLYENEFYAYDRTCPYDYAVNGLRIKVNVAPGDFYAICPKCSTNYSLEIGGTPASGIGRYPLKNYKTSFDGQSVYVWHH
jgi:nitrite reductase/ring-hydroxylating ferredoxin subunit